MRTGGVRRAATPSGGRSLPTHAFSARLPQLVIQSVSTTITRLKAGAKSSGEPLPLSRASAR